MCRLGPERSLDNLSRLADCQLSINRCISHCISSNNKGRTSNWGNNFYWPSQTDLWKLTVPTTTVWAMDWICICCMHFYQYTLHSHPYPDPDPPPLKINVVLDQIVFVCVVSYILLCPWQRAKLFKMSCFRHIWKVNTWLLAVIRFCLPSYFNNIHKLTSKPAPKFLRAQTNCR